MIRRKWILILTLCIFLFWNCGKNDKTSEVVNIEIDIDASEKVNISEFIDSVQYIKLETLDESLIRDICDVCFIDNKIAITDKGEKQVLFFDNEGHFLHKIKRVGRGPGEYINMLTALFDTVHKRVMIYDQNPRKMLFFTLEGEFIKGISGFSEKALIRDLCLLPNGHFLCYTFDCMTNERGETFPGSEKFSGLWEVDSAGIFIRNFFNVEEIYPGLFNQFNSYFNVSTEGRVSFRDALFNGIYHFEGDSLRQYVSFEIKNDPIYQYKGDRNPIGKKYTKSMSSHEKGNYIFVAWITVNDPQGYFITVYSKSEGKNILININHKDDFWAGYGESGFTDSNRSDVLVTSIQGVKIYDILQSNKTVPAVKEKLQALIQGMSERDIDDMNPVLQLFYVKNRSK
jgi:hypothetical protein